MVGPMTVVRPSVRRPHLRLLTRRVLARHPEAWLYALALAAAGLLLVDAARSARPGARVEDRASWLGSWSGWMLMVLAMMLPVLAPQARQVAMRSLWQRRHRAVVGYLAAYLAVWAVAGVAVVGALHGVGQPHPPPGVTAAALAGAALWQASPPRRRIMRRCGSVRLGAAQGFAADRDCVAAGGRTGLRCALTCGPVMVAMATGHHYPGLMAGLLALLLTERARGPNPDRRAGRPLEAWCLAGYAALFVVWA
jgi:predicted metal-binding membrane protein